MNLESRQVTLDVELLDEAGALVTTGQVSLSAMGQLAAFVDEDKFNWADTVDFSSFQGTVRVMGDGRIAATVIQSRPSQFATQPVAPIAP